jgi:hypothetical protein
MDAERLVHVQIELSVLLRVLLPQVLGNVVELLDYSFKCHSTSP